jgi:hypothetical protein
VALGVRVDGGHTCFSKERGPNHISDVLGMTAGPDGRVYVLNRRSGACEVGGCAAIAVFRRDGSYERTIKPFPPNLPLERLKATLAFRDDDGRLIPVIHRNNGLTFYPCEDVPQHMAVTPDGHLLLAVVPSDVEPGRPGAQARLAVLDAEGGVPHDTYAGPALHKGCGFDLGATALAAGSKGKFAYVVGIGPKPKCQSFAAIFKCQVSHAVYWVPLPARGPAEAFFGNPAEPGKDAKHLSAPGGLAVDGKGHLLVSDTGNGRVVVLNEKDAAMVDSFPVPSPGWLAVHPRSGAVYVNSGDSVVKFSGWKEHKELARLQLPKRGRHRRFRWSFALETSAEPPTLWVGRNETTWDRGIALLRCEDRGGKFSDLEKPGYYKSRAFRDITVDPTKSEVAYIPSHGGSGALRVLNEATGKTRTVRMTGLKGTFVLGLDGRSHGMQHHHTKGFTLQDINGKLLPFPVTGGRLPETHGAGTKPPRPNLCVDRKGNIYAWSRGRGINLYSPDGKLVRTVIHQVLGRHVGGPRVDAAGNVYIAESVRSAAQPPYPRTFKGRLGKSPIIEKGYATLYGSIVKFGPEGGTVWCPRLGKGGQDKRPFDEARSKNAELKIQDVIARNKPGGKLQGAKWRRFGFSPMLDMALARSCHCLSAEFDVDDFGRVFYPDQARFRIVVLDTGGNQILRFGEYGNQDCLGPESYVIDPKSKHLRPRRTGDPENLPSPLARPAIPLAWIGGLAVTDRYVYVSDALNRRAMRCRIGYAAEETCPISR